MGDPRRSIMNFKTLSLLILLTASLSLPTFSEEGKASHYGCGDGFAGRRTASGERMDPRKMTCAHRRYRMGTILEVTSVKTGKKIHVRVNDRGPFVRGRVLDLSYGAFRSLSSRGGLLNVRFHPVGCAGKAHKALPKNCRTKKKPVTQIPKVPLVIPEDEGIYSIPLVEEIDHLKT
jgi:rare lipoprotein A (peptidoglycan hydrolase)